MASDEFSSSIMRIGPPWDLALSGISRLLMTSALLGPSYFECFPRYSRQRAINKLLHINFEKLLI